MFPIAGVRIGLFTPGQAFETVAQTQINKLREPSMKIAEMVAEQLNIIFHAAILKVPNYLAGSRGIFSILSVQR